MNAKTLLPVLLLGGLPALVLCCDNGGKSSTTGGLGSDDCPYGTFRPMGLADCVFPADDTNGNPLATSDNRCATGQPAVPPACVSDNGERPYLSLSMSCAPNYHFEAGSCQRSGGFAGTNGFAGTFEPAGTNGFAGDGSAGTTGAAGDDGLAGTIGAAGDAFAGAAGFAGSAAGGTGGTSFTGGGGTAVSGDLEGPSDDGSVD
jgi:hypothetical protein